MATKGQLQFVTRNLKTLKRESQALVQAVNSYVNQIICMGQSWVDNRGTAGPTFQEVSATFAESLPLIVDKLDEFQGQAEVGAEGGAGRPSSTPQQSSPDSSLSFTVLKTSTSSPAHSSKSSKQPSDQLMTQILNRLDNLENDHVKIEDLDERLGQIETERREVDKEKVKEVEGRLDHMDNSLKDLTTFADRIERMEERMKALPFVDQELKKLQKEITIDRKTVDDIRTEVTSLGSQLQLSRKQPVGFTAQIPNTVTHTRDTPVTGFTTILTNRGDHYNPSTGEFTAPVDGMYLSSLTHTQYGSDVRELQVECKRNKAGPGGEVEDVVCETWTRGNYTSCTGVEVVNMSAGDRLFVRAEYGGDIMWPSSFSCCLIG